MTVRTTPLITVPHNESRGFFIEIHLPKVFKRRLRALFTASKRLALSGAAILIGFSL
jgi:hypothetical protein